MGRRTKYTFISKKIYKWSTGTWKGAQPHKSSEKRKSKTPRVITLHLLGWLFSKRQEVTYVDKDVEKWEPSYLGGDVNWHSHCGK